MKVAIVHDWLNQMGGAEEVLEALTDLFPGAPIYTSIYAPDRMPDAYRKWDIRPSFMNRLPLVKSHHQPFLPLYPLAFESFDLSEYELIVSNKSGFCHGVVTSPETLHVCYCLTPTRFLWDYHGYVQREGVGAVGRLLLSPALNYLRTWDRLAADRVDHFISISTAVQRRVNKYYRRESVVIYPPVRIEEAATDGSREDYFLIVSRLIPYKRIDLAVQAFNELGLPLVVIGDGRDRSRLESMARPNIRFLGKLPNDEVRTHLRACRAFVFPGVEDFGIAPLRALAEGRPVIAFGGGGALDTITDGVTGTFFYPQTAPALADAVRRFDDRQFEPARIVREAARFDLSVFRREITTFIEQKLAEHRAAACHRITEG